LEDLYPFQVNKNGENGGKTFKFGMTKIPEREAGFCVVSSLFGLAMGKAPTLYLCWYGFHFDVMALVENLCSRGFF